MKKAQSGTHHNLAVNITYDLALDSCNLSVMLMAQVHSNFCRCASSELSAPYVHRKLCSRFDIEMPCEHVQCVLHLHGIACIMSNSIHQT